MLWAAIDMQRMGRNGHATFLAVLGFILSVPRCVHPTSLENGSSVVFRRARRRFLARERTETDSRPPVRVFSFLILCLAMCAICYSPPTSQRSSDSFPEPGLLGFRPDVRHPRIWSHQVWSHQVLGHQQEWCHWNGPRG